jgi:hypothetical protein
MSEKKKDPAGKKETGDSEKFPGYPPYPQGEDIYYQEEETDLDPESPDKMKLAAEPVDTPNEKGFEDDVSGGDLDVPGAELDDTQEEIGSEDEENNYYSLGGDDKESQEENTGRD